MEEVLRKNKRRCLASSQGILCQSRREGRWQGFRERKVGWCIKYDNYQSDWATKIWRRWLLSANGGGDSKELVKNLYQFDKEVIWITGKNNQNSNFNAGALQPKWTPLLKLICSRLIPIMHTSHITLDRATLLYAVIKKMRIDAGWIIFKNIIDSI